MNIHILIGINLYFRKEMKLHILHPALVSNFYKTYRLFENVFFVILLLKDSICIIYSNQYVIASFAHEMYMFSRETHLRICGCSVREMMSSGYMF